MAKEEKEVMIVDSLSPCGEVHWQVKEYLVGLGNRNPLFTGKIELNFKDGKLMDINETKRTKF